MPDNGREYKVGPGRPPLHTRFKKGRSGNPGGRRSKSLPALLAAALDEEVYITTNGRRPSGNPGRWRIASILMSCRAKTVASVAMIPGRSATVKRT